MKKLKRKKQEIAWFCYYCGEYLGTTGADGAKLGNCPTCGREQTGSGITIVPKEVTNYLRMLEKRRKEEKKLRNRARD